jgi:fructosamine-3-kinase
VTVQPLAAKLSQLLGEPVSRLQPAAGGDINQAFVVTLANGRNLFAKTHPAALPQMFRREAEGLAWLAEASALRVPRVIVASEADAEGPACLVLEYIQPAPRGGVQWNERLGRGLATLHRHGAREFGFHDANYLASLPQDNTPYARWPEFYAERRLAPLVELAERRGLLPPALVRRLELLYTRLPALVGDAEPPARLHGDLWSGNVLATASGEPVLIDPAVYGGHREIDLAMMRLFGGFEARVFAAYDETYPLTPDHADRVALYQLYPLLAHVNLFGASYVPQLDHTLARYV